MTRTLSVRNRQRTRVVDTRLLRRIALWTLQECCGAAEFELGVHLVGAAEITRVNEAYLQHAGSTDVITFDHREDAASNPRRAGPTPRENGVPRSAVHGEIFISLDDAVKQARQFRTTWQRELLRYLVHGLLHLHGFTDGSTAARRHMKREENRWLRHAARHFSFRLLGRSRQGP